jgi:hypothetical protein
MDIPDFLLEREALQKRMETHRLAASAVLSERENAVVPKMLRTGAGLLFGFGARGESAGWVSSLVWSMMAPAVLSMVRQGGDTLIHNLLQKVFPGKSSREASE